MTKFTQVMKRIGTQETVSILEQVETVSEETGADVLDWEDNGKTIQCVIQTTKSQKNTGGMMFEPSERGDLVREIYNLYTDVEVLNNQRVKRSDGLLYEIKNVEHNGKGSVLEHYKAYITRVDNQ